MSLTLLVLADPAAAWLKLLGTLGHQVTVIVSNDPARVRECAPQADVIVNGTSNPPLLSAAIPPARRARWIHSLWTGVDNVLCPEIMASPLPLTNGRGVFRRPLAEWTIGAMLYFAYRMRRMIRQQQAGVWEAFTTEEIQGKTLGIVGYGGIGSTAAELARPFGMRIVALRRRPELFQPDSRVDQSFARSQINELMAASDYVLLAAPLTDETRGMIGASQIAAMKPAGVLINVGRGAVVDETALIRALEAGKIRGAALDVFSVEPLPSGHPFYSMENVLLSPHTADHVQDFIHLAVESFLDNLRRFQAGQPLLNLVDKHAGY
ncbi:MAG TPA: D-2-hydroxyacid dehydrogenase [Bryobacteraceae bacterium]|nr:D-2-hydroxyacid dehydrogenase [Bryobacteraceae bacterium]